MQSEDNFFLTVALKKLGTYLLGNPLSMKYFFAKGQQRETNEQMCEFLQLESWQLSQATYFVKRPTASRGALWEKDRPLLSIDWGS